MVDQAQTVNRAPASANGRTELPPRAVARNTAEFLSDFTTLAELQSKLLFVDLHEGVSRLMFSAIVVVVGAGVALGCIPIALAALALLIHSYAGLSLTASFGIALATGLMLAATLLIPSLLALKNGWWMFERSADEWRKNMRWAKDAMKRMSQGNSNPPPPAGLW